MQEIVTEINKFSKEGGMFATDGYKDYKTSKVLNVVSLSLSMGALVLILDNRSTRSVNIGLGMSLASLIPSSFAIRYRKKGNQKVAKAIWLHNRDILF